MFKGLFAPLTWKVRSPKAVSSQDVSSVSRTWSRQNWTETAVLDLSHAHCPVHYLKWPTHALNIRNAIMSTCMCKQKFKYCLFLFNSPHFRECSCRNWDNTLNTKKGPFYLRRPSTDGSCPGKTGEPLNNYFLFTN
jgi:hypothetical protein